MWWQYACVFFGCILVDIVPLPLPPAFTVMILFQVLYDLNIWVVLTIGVAGSIIGRYSLALYIPYVSSKLFRKAKNDDVHFLGSRMKQKGWKGLALILIYSLMPLPTTPLFIAGGMAKMKPAYILPGFVIGKIISDMVTVFLGDYAAKNTIDIAQGMVSAKSIVGFSLGLLLVLALLFIDWRTLLQKKKLKLHFHIWK
jgi:membrane protein YqaA with SNARE-associated domain